MLYTHMRRINTNRASDALETLARAERIERGKKSEKEDESFRLH